MSATQNGLDIKYLRPIEYPWAFSALYIALDVIGAKPEVRDNQPVATILFLPITIYWSGGAFGDLSNLNSAPDICGCLLDMTFTIRSV
jgi:hypothetical protein